MTTKIILIFILILMVFGSSKQTLETNVQTEDYFINGNDELASISSDGDGTSSSPYIINDKTFSCKSLEYPIGLSIENTNAYFEVHNVIIPNDECPFDLHPYGEIDNIRFPLGINLVNVTHGKITTAQVFSQISLYKSSEISLDQVNILGERYSKTGISQINIYTSSDISIDHVNITKSDSGIFIESSTNIKISNSNTSITPYTDFSIVNLDKNFDYYFENSNKIQLSTAKSTSHNTFGLYMINCSGNQISDNILFNKKIGLNIFGSKQNTIKNNQISANDIGLSLEKSNENIIMENSFFNNTNGLRMFHSNDNTFVNNQIANNTNNYSDVSGTHNIFTDELNLSSNSVQVKNAPSFTIELLLVGIMILYLNKRRRIEK